ncbi:MAG: hypothetical protein ACPGSB_02790 [Opitutales bacterium]
MNEQEIELIRGCLPEGRTKYHTFKDHYAFQILSWRLGSGSMKVRELKSHPEFSRYIHRPAFAEFLKRVPEGEINQSRLHAYWPQHEDIQTFRLTLDKWGDFDPDNDDWNQTSRRGYNLVLQLNFPVPHGRYYQSLDDEDEDPLGFGSSCHPARFGILNTMSWARIDLNLDQGTALIEEIQTDWLRDARRQRNQIEQRLQEGKLSRYDEWWGIKVHKILSYIDAYIEPLVRLWDEATLEATLWFLHEELGLKRIYYHTWESGLWFKRLSPSFGPPRSLYTKLPQRFGFECVGHGPEFITERPEIRRRMKKKPPTYRSPKWWFMDLTHAA